jgi:hypothetical protein
MEEPERRAYLEAIVEQAESDTVRLKALELLAQVDSGEPPQPPPPEPGFTEWYSEHPEHLLSRSSGTESGFCVIC